MALALVALALVLAACGTAGGGVKSAKAFRLGASVIDPVVGSSVTYTATIGAVAPATGTPTGTVDFEDGGTAITACSAQTLVSGVATCSTTYGAVGTHTITAVYSGDANFASSTSAALTIIVSQGQTTVTLTEGSAPAAALAPTGYAATPFVGPASSR